MDPGEADKPDRAELENRVDELERKLSKMLPDRRGVIKGLGAAAIGGAAVGASSGGASGQSAAGQVGTASEPVDVQAADVAAQSVSTEHSNTKTDVFAALSAAKRAPDSETGDHTDFYTSGLQQAISDAQSGLVAEDMPKQVLVDGSWSEPVSIPTGTKGLTISSPSVESWVIAPDGSDSPTITVQDRDTTLRGLTIKNKNTGTDQPSVKVNANEFYAENISLHQSGNGRGLVLDGTTTAWLWSGDAQFGGMWGLDLVGAGRVFISDWDSAGNGLRTDSNTGRLYVSNSRFYNGDAAGMLLRGDAPRASGVRCQTNGGAGINLSANRASITGLSAFLNSTNGVYANDCNGAFISGVLNANTDNDLWFDGNAKGCVFVGYSGSTRMTGTNCMSFGVVDGDLTFDSGATDCKHYGVVTGTVTNNGTNCSVV